MSAVIEQDSDWNLDICPEILGAKRKGKDQSKRVDQLGCGGGGGRSGHCDDLEIAVKMVLRGDAPPDAIRETVSNRMKRLTLA